MTLHHASDCLPRNFPRATSRQHFGPTRTIEIHSLRIVPPMRSHIGEVNGAMLDYPQPEFSRREVTRSGEFLSQRAPWSPDVHAEFIRVFRVAYNWRDAHQYPMRRLRYEMAGKIRTLRLQAITAARAKRMQSIRKKLTRSSITLASIQDLGGCRAILTSIADVHQLVALYRLGASAHDIQKDTSYNTRVC